jgi:hypothetical protein
MGVIQRPGGQANHDRVAAPQTASNACSVFLLLIQSVSNLRERYRNVVLPFRGAWIGFRQLLVPE